MTAEQLATIADATEEQTPLPDGWRWAKLSEIALVKPDNGIFKHRHEFGHGVPIVNILDLFKPIELDLTTTERVEVTDAELNRFSIHSGDLFFCRSSLKRDGIGWCCYVEDVLEPSVFECHIIRLRPNPEIAFYKYIAHYWRLSEVREKVIERAKTSTMTTINQQELVEIEIPLPPTIEEQRRIATVLDEQMKAVEQARRAVEDQLAAAKLLPGTFLRSVFESEDAQNWQERKLGDVCNIQLGKMLSPKSKMGDHPLPYLRNANVQWAKLDLDSISEMDFSESEQKKFELKYGDLLVCEGGAPGRAAVWREEIKPCFYQKALHRLRPLDNSIFPEFLMYRLWFGANEGEFLDSHAQTTIAHLPAIRLLELLVKLPQIEAQKEITETLNEQMQEVEQLKKSLTEQLEAIKKMPSALLRKAFAGEV